MFSYCTVLLHFCTALFHWYCNCPVTLYDTEILHVRLFAVTVEKLRGEQNKGLDVYFSSFILWSFREIFGVFFFFFLSFGLEAKISGFIYKTWSITSKHASTLLTRPMENCPISLCIGWTWGVINHRNVKSFFFCC